MAAPNMALLHIMYAMKNRLGSICRFGGLCARRRAFTIAKPAIVSGLAGAVRESRRLAKQKPNGAEGIRT
jgi:hypothetical protein